MTQTYAPLFTVACAHGYAPDVRADLGFTATADTAAMMRNARMLARVSSGTLVVLIERDAQGQARVSVDGVVLRYGIRLKNQHFTNFTALTFDPARSLPVWRNTASPTQLDAPRLVDREQVDSDVFGVVEITVSAALLDARPAFELEFDPKEQVLRYFVQAQELSSRELEQLEIADTGAALDDRERIDFARVDPALLSADPVAQSLLTGGAATLVVFQSLAPVPRRSGGRRGIQLSRNGDVLVAHLPQPGPERPSSDLIVRVSKPPR